MMQKISDYERKLMKIIWTRGGSALYADIAKELEDQGTPWTKNTIVTLLSRLTGKGFLATKKQGLHRNRYTALISEEVYQTEQTETFLSKVYEGDAAGLVSTLIQRDLLSAADYEALKKHWEDSE